MINTIHPPTDFQSMTHTPINPPPKVVPASGSSAEHMAAVSGSLAGRLKAWIVSASVVASATSVLLHLSLVAMAAVVTVGLVQRHEDRASPEGELILALSPETELQEISEAALDASAPSVSSGDLPLPEVATSGVSEGMGGDDAPGLGDGLGTIGEGMGGAGGGDIGDGQGLGAGGSGGGAASFFGVEAKGSRFTYVLDVSGSMAGEKLQAMKNQLAESISGLQDHMSFYIILYSSDSRELGARSKWTLATLAGKKWAIENINKLDAAGGTLPWSGFEKAFAIRPLPDAIYFMTDGEFDPSVADLIAMRNQGSKKIPIHCLTFVNQEAEEVMRKIASTSSGTYAHIEGPK